MYYYILEPPANRGVRQSYQRLRDILINLGIAGEMVGASPARGADELALMGLEKGYSTIVAVGQDAFINQVAGAVIGRAVLGIVPINASRNVTDLVGVNSLRSAAEALKHRRLSETNTVVIEPDTLVFLDAQIKPPKLAKINLVIDNKVRAYAYFNYLSFNRDLRLSIESVHLIEQKKILGLFNIGGQPLKSSSIFHGRSVRITTDPELPITVAGVPIARTPSQLKLVPNSLKIITKRGTLT